MATNMKSQPLSENFRSDILLLSSYLARQQDSSSQAHPSNGELALFSSISCLLTTGTNLCPKAKSVNAVAGYFVKTVTDSGTCRALDYIVCTENGRQHGESVEFYRKNLESGEGMAGDRNNQALKWSPTLDRDEYTLDVITPVARRGKVLLHGWDPSNLTGSKGLKYVVNNLSLP